MGISSSRNAFGAVKRSTLSQCRKGECQLIIVLPCQAASYTALLRGIVIDPNREQDEHHTIDVTSHHTSDTCTFVLHHQSGASHRIPARPLVSNVMPRPGASIRPGALTSICSS